MKSQEGLLSSETMESFMANMDELVKNNHKSFIQEGPCSNNDNGSHVTVLDEFVLKNTNEKNAFAAKHYRLYDIPGNYPVAKRVNQIIWPTSVKRVPIPSAVVPATCDQKLKQGPTNPPKLFTGRNAIGNMQAAGFVSANNISRGNRILRSTSSMWMRHAPKSAEKGFQNYKHFVLDTKLMKLEENIVEDVLAENEELRKMIEDATKSTGKASDKMKEHFNDPGMVKKVKSMKQVCADAAETGNQTMDANNLMKIDNKEHIISKSINDREGLLEYRNGGTIESSCQTSVSTNLGSIAIQADELMRYLRKSCRKIYRTDEITKKIKMQELLEDRGKIYADKKDDKKVVDNSVCGDSLSNRDGHLEFQTEEKIKGVAKEEKRVYCCICETEGACSQQKVFEDESKSMAQSEINIVEDHKEDGTGRIIIPKIVITPDAVSKVSLDVSGDLIMVAKAKGTGSLNVHNLYVENSRNDEIPYRKVNIDESACESQVSRIMPNSTQKYKSSERSGCSSTSSSDEARTNARTFTENNYERNILEQEFDSISTEDMVVHNYTSEEHIDATTAHLDDSLLFGDDSVFGILGVFCRSGLHSWYGLDSDVEC